MEETNNSVSPTLSETRNIFRTSNIGLFIYLALNILLIWTILSGFLFSWQALLVSIAVYAFSLLVALSPVGEWCLRMQTGCSSISKKKWAKERELLMPLFEEVYAKAKQKVPSLQDGIRLYVNKDSAPNAFATGRKTICVTRGLVTLPPEQITAVLAHEFGHIAHRDTYLILGITVGNFIVTMLVMFIKTVVWFVTAFAEADALSSRGDLGVGSGVQRMLAVFAWVLSMIGINVFMWIWGKLGVLLVMRTSRGNEYEADRFSANCGYKDGLLAFFDVLQRHEGGKPHGIFATLSSSHPDTADRISHIENLAG